MKIVLFLTLVMLVCGEDEYLEVTDAPVTYKTFGLTPDEIEHICRADRKKIARDLTDCLQPLSQELLDVISSKCLDNIGNLKDYERVRFTLVMLCGSEYPEMTFIKIIFGFDAIRQARACIEKTLTVIF